MCHATYSNIVLVIKSFAITNPLIFMQARVGIKFGNFA